MTPKDRKILETKYLRAKYEYYVLALPTMLDADFDKLEKNLQDISSQVTELVDFPTIKEIKKLGLDPSEIVDIGDKSLTEKKVPHLLDMLSLQKIQINDEENIPFHDVQLFLNKSKSSHIEATGKYDGSGQECIYRFINGKHILSESNTRGDKIFGFSKIDKMKHIVPTELKNTKKFGEKTILIRGEIIMEEELWKNNFSEPNKIDNSRNFIAGLMNRVEFSVKELKMVTFVAYTLIIIDENINEHIYPDNSMFLLENFGLNIKYKPLVIKEDATIEGFKKIYNIFKNYRENICPFSLDGFVIKFPEDKRKKLGEGSHHPNWAFAGKFPAIEISATIIDIIWTIGKDGSFCPKAQFEPVELLGTIVQFASLSNIGTIYKNKYYIGSMVSLKKSGEIIPMLTGILEHSKHEKEYDKQIEDFMKESI